MELRVLSGPQAGCRLPLGAGTYRAGADETCDVVLEGLPEQQLAFVLYIGQRSIGLESLSDAVRLGGRCVTGLVALMQGQVFELDQWLFAVDDPQAPWPADPEALRKHVEPDTAAVESESPGGDEQTSLAAEGGADDMPVTEQILSDDRREAQTVAPSTGADAAVSATASRRKVPFWVIGLAGTAAFLLCGVMVLVMSLAPSRSAADVEDSHRPVDELTRLAASAPGEVQFEHVGTARLKLTGTVATRAEKVKLTRDARAIEPAVLLQLSADEDLDALASDALSLFPQSGVALEKVHAGRLVLTGRVSEAKLRDQIVAALWDGVPGLKAIDSQVLAGDEVLGFLSAALNEAGLAGRIAGELDRNDSGRLIVRGVLPDGDRPSWLGVHQKLEQRFGAALAIVEEIRAPGVLPPSVAPVAQDIVAVVKGPMPYVLLRDGTKRAMSAGAGER
ncbi:type III secretion system inner membrane ring subunit SctD [Peristeroidobacter soli]|uniref:type III secretion system inner membrane ring subunit SctD n=1 Tax=Peristeroidobacter soli TaxID=2497877 RepID=UPI00101D1B1F|nr:type III secretion system inner membrane ring subunit SctD [Peristeroidobacter soli]